MAAVYIRYVLSDAMDYGNLICGDAGPAFAEDYGWSCISLKQVEADAASVYVIDPWVHESELPRLAALIRDREAAFVLRMIDSPWKVRDQPWYRFCREFIDTPRAHFMLAYAPADLTSHFMSLSRQSRYVIAPYVYRPEHERDIAHAGRLRRVLVSGRPVANYYPLRAQAHFHARFVPPFAFVGDILRHPGYSRQAIRQDAQAKLGDDYIDALARYRFAFVCSATTRSEFLKYREFAYAGVAPVGDLPYSLLDCPEGAFIPWRRNVVALTRQIAFTSDSETIARAFRLFMSRRRDRATLQQSVNAQLLDLAPRRMASRPGQGAGSYSPAM